MTSGDQPSGSSKDSHIYRLDAGETVSTGVANATAEALDTDPINLEPLYYVLDPDALDTLFYPSQQGTSHGDGCVEFRYHDSEVVVHSDGRIVVTPSRPKEARKADD